MKNNIDEYLNEIAKSGQYWFKNLLKLNEKKIEDEFAGSVINMYQAFFDNTQSYLKAQQNFYQDQMNMWQSFFKDEESKVSKEINKPEDKRFTDKEWQNNPFFVYLKESYLNTSNYLIEFVSRSDMDEETKNRIKFFMTQYLDAISPTNFAFTNPDVIKLAVETGGMSLVEGIKNMATDMNNGYMAQSNETKYSVGENLAVTKGKVVYRNSLIELIQYTPLTETVFKTPLLIVPPCINKYYILDLQQENSFVSYLVNQGYQVFLISWKSADAENRTYRWEEYVNLGVITALEVVREISKIEKINTLGYCVGGLILTTALLVLKEQNIDWINSMTHLTVMLDHTDPGDMRYFIDRDLLELEEEKKKGGGIISGRIIAHTFSSLRANEMIWNYWINNYLMGKTPEDFDILYWNTDVVDLPIVMHSFFLKKFYANNDLIKNRLMVDAIKMDVRKIDCPYYLFAAQKDHIVPWTSAFATTKYFKNPNGRFVLGAAGHTAGVINPVSANKRNYWVNKKLTTDAETWFKNATQIPGSWWQDYSNWLKPLSGNAVKPKKTQGNSKYKPIMDAPGEYIMAKALPLSVAIVS